jgi:hypothetical protein
MHRYPVRDSGDGEDWRLDGGVVSYWAWSGFDVVQDLQGNVTDPRSTRGRSTSGSSGVLVATRQQALNPGGAKHIAGRLLPNAKRERALRTTTRRTGCNT